MQFASFVLSIHEHYQGDCDCKSNIIPVSKELFTITAIIHQQYQQVDCLCIGSYSSMERQKDITKNINGLQGSREEEWEHMLM